MNPETIDLLRADLAAADYRTTAVTALLGEEAAAARERGVLSPARRILAQRDSSPLRTLVRVFLIGESVYAAELEAALPALTVTGAIELGLVSETVQSEYRAALSLNPVAIADSWSSQAREWWIIADLDDRLRGGPARPDHVMGVGAATRSLIAQMPPTEIDQGLDLGTGCGVVALHLSLRGRVIATDISERALRFARANARLNEVDEVIEFRHGDLFAPVEREQFDLILSNPPFVIAPRNGGAENRYEYRQTSRVGDALVEEVVRGGAHRLREGGTLLCLANWECPWGSNGLERVRGWIEQASAESGALAAWVLERDRVLPTRYAEIWARDGGARAGSAEFEELMDSWLEDFSERRIVAIGLGSIRVRRMSERGAATFVQLDEASGVFARTGLGVALAETFDAGIALQAMTDDMVLDTRWVVAKTVVEDREHVPGLEAPRAITLRTDYPIERRVIADTLLAAAVGACDGELTLRQIADALATLLEVDAAAASEALMGGVRELVWFGMLTFAESTSR